MTMAEPIEAQVRAARENAGVWLWEEGAFLRFTGKDVASWLQTQTTNNVEALAPGGGCANALLDRKGRLQAHFTLHRWEDDYWLITTAGQTEGLLKHLDAHLFIEDVAMEDASAELGHVVLEGPRASWILAEALGQDAVDAAAALPAESHACLPLEILGHQALCFRQSPAGGDGFLLVTQRTETRRFFDALLRAGASAGLTAVGPEAQEILRIEAGLPRWGRDMDSAFRIPETTLERTCVDYDKGCFLGQEVVARLRAYSSVKQALMGLECECAADALPPHGEALYLAAPSGAEAANASPETPKKVGQIMSRTYSPTLGRVIALAYLDRDHRTPHRRPRLAGPSGDKPFNATVKVLPFYEAPAPAARAERLYHQALERFEQDASDEDRGAIDLLKEAILLKPDYEDAYEALGVILNRQGHVDEAIRYMRRLAAMNPNCVMAHTNLSVFYMTKGMIQEAEEEKAQAAVLQMKHAREARKAGEIAAEERARIEREARERIGMFQEVLELDPSDPLATYGLGAAYMQLQEYGDAIPWFSRAAETQKDYSAAFLNLGKCLEFTGRVEEAADAYRKGIEAANRKGDLMPMREMERRLKHLPTGPEEAKPAGSG